MEQKAITDVSPVLRKAVQEKIIFDGTALYDAPVAQFYDLDLWDYHLNSCKDAFGSTFHHRMAIKSNSISHNVNYVWRVHGFGIECASIGEVQHSILRCKIPKDMIVFDSPCKTKIELDYAVKEKIHLNLDNFEEYRRACDIIGETTSNTESGIIGVRINPLVGAGEIAALSVSTKYSKFGIPITEKENIIKCYQRSPWLNSVHVHVGSGGMGVTLLTAGIKVAVGLAKEINKLIAKQQVTSIDIGGGLPANYKGDEWASEIVPLFKEYAEHLRKEIPELFSGEFTVFTEFGQSLNAKCGFLASRIEWIKGSDAKPINIIHFGADVCVRQVYTKDHNRRLEAYRCDGSRFPDDHKMVEQDVGGPLCFQGDFVGKDVELPEGLKSGDIIIMKEGGANTLSIYSRHCSRLCPPVYGYRWHEYGTVVGEIIELKAREKIEELSNFWGQLRQT